MNAAADAELIFIFWTNLAAVLSLCVSVVSLSRPEFTAENAELAESK
jgi:hypothetical protein